MEIQEAFRYIENRTKELVKYSDKLRDSFKEIDFAFEPLFKQAGITYSLTPSFAYDHNMPIFLSIGKYRSGDWGFMYDYGAGSDIYWLGDVGRSILKKAIPKIPELLEGYINLLDARTEEYKQVSEMAGAMNNALKELENK